MTIKGSDELYGLVLAGGLSSRMGMDKGLIKYHHNLPQREYLYKLLSRFCAKTFLGLRKDQQEENVDFPIILDHDAYQGPYKSILAAHLAHPSKSWLVVACDLPFLNEKTLQKLVQERDRTKMATAYYNRQHNFPEPLVCIWEREGFYRALNSASSGPQSPGKFLLGMDYKKVIPSQAQELRNVNNYEEYVQAKEEIRFFLS